jgi:asparagine synthase (glutamine-hydrolysing)
MSGFCGWVGSGLDHTASQQALEDMTRELGSPAGTQDRSVMRETAAAAASTGLYPASLHEEDGILSLLFGTPRWADSTLAGIAESISPAAALTTAYRRQGRDFLPLLHGPFSLAILDRDSALLAIDRMGIHTLSWAQRQGMLIFSTQTRSASAHPLVNREIDPQAIYNYFYFHHIPSPGTIYRDVEKLMPAQYLSFQNGRIEKDFYWSLPFSDQDSTPFETHARRFRELLNESTAATSRGGRLGAFLSGGTDSSTICGVLSECSNNAVESYSIGYSAAEFDEMDYARIAARHFHCNPHEYYLKPDDVMSAIPVITGYYDEPFGNDSAVPVYVCAKQAANDGIGVMLAGDGGDEVFGGNVRYAKQKIFEIYGKVPAILRKGMIEPLLFHIPGGERLPLLRKARSYIKQANIPLPERMESYNFLYRQSLEEAFEPGFLGQIDPSTPDALLRDVYFRTASADPINRMMQLDLKFTLADNDLRKVSGMCEAAGVEVRYPLLDDRLVEFSGELPPDYRVRGQQLRWFFKQALRDFLPREIINKSKHGFGLPFGEWALSHPPLRELVNDSLGQFARRGILRQSYILELQRQHKEIHPTYFGKMVWVILMLEQWLQAHDSDSMHS